MTRAATIAVAVASLLLAACGPPAVAPPAATPKPFHLASACDVAPSAGLQWLIEAKPRTIAEVPDLIVPLTRVVSEERLDAFAAANGGIDLRTVRDLCLSRYRDATLAIAVTPLDAARVERAWRARVTVEGGRAVPSSDPPVVRLWGELGGEPQTVLLLGNEAAALERGPRGPSRAAEAFALGKLHRAAPALRGAAVAEIARLLGPAPLRAFAPGPFEGEAARGLGGLLRVATAVGAAAWFAPAGSAGGARVAIKLVLTGAWGDEEGAEAARRRLEAATHVLAESPPGRLFGLAKPLAEPSVRLQEGALVLDVTLDAEVLSRGLRDAIDAEVYEIMQR